MNALKHVTPWMRGGVVGALCALALSAAPASAGVVCSTSSTIPQTFADALLHTRHGVTCCNNSTANKRVAIFYNGECSVAAANDITWLDTNLYVDAALVTPSDSDNAFCTSTGDNSLDHWSSNETQGVAILTPGCHTIRAVHQLIGAGSYRIDDTSLIVLD